MPLVFISHTLLIIGKYKAKRAPKSEAKNMIEENKKNVSAFFPPTRTLLFEIRSQTSHEKKRKVLDRKKELDADFEQKMWRIAHRREIEEEEVIYLLSKTN